MQQAAARASGEKGASPLPPQRWYWLKHSHCTASHSPSTATATSSSPGLLPAPDPSGERSRWQPCLSSSRISPCRHKTPTRNDHSKRQERPHTTNPWVQWPEQPQVLWTGRDRAQARPPGPVCCPCPTPHRGTAAHRGPSKMWKYRPVLRLLIAKLFGRKRRV